jgi:hypothetical protein
MATEWTMPGMLHQVQKGFPGVNKIPVLDGIEEECMVSTVATGCNDFGFP